MEIETTAKADDQPSETQENLNGNLKEGSLISSLPKADVAVVPAVVKPYNHFCKYSIVRKTIRNTEFGSSWIERCKCLRYLFVDCKYFHGVGNYPSIRKAWYDRNGNLIRVTGTNDLRDSQKIDCNAQK